MEREDVLSLDTRRRVFDVIRREPGLHLRELERVTGLPLSTLRYHLDYLRQHRLVHAEHDRRFVRFFPRAETAAPERAALAALRQVALRRVVLFLLERGGSAPYRAIREAFPVPASTLAVHLAELTRRGILERVPVGRESRYDVRDAEKVIRLLHTYRSSFLDRLVDHLLDAVYQEDTADTVD